MKNLIAKIATIGTGIVLLVGVTNYANRAENNRRLGIQRAIIQNSQTITNNLGSFVASVHDEQEFITYSILTIVEKEGKYGNSKISATDYDKDGVLDSMNTTQILQGSKLEEMTLQRTQEIYANFTNTVNCGGYIVPKIIEN
ncbi:hypothetical protein KA107_03595 [Candidatus Pacearchaeota archaeon]|nr:hypothetical protein [Candidatus Pacearchaeota archaeon]